MGYIRLLIASLIAFFVVKAMRSTTKPSGADPHRQVEPPPRRQMVRCAECGVYLLQDRAVPAGKGAYYCSADCAQAASR